jgi:hypothetical protein
MMLLKHIIQLGEKWSLEGLGFSIGDEEACSSKHSSEYRVFLDY